RRVDRAARRALRRCGRLGLRAPTLVASTAAGGDGSRRSRGLARPGAVVSEVVEEREELEARREFLIRSLEDLEAERDAGNIDDDTYERLHGDYTARAAAVLRALDGEKPEPAAEGSQVPAGRRALIIGAIVAFAVVAAVVLGITIAPRLPGQTVTGGAP